MSEGLEAFQTLKEAVYDDGELFSKYYKNEFSVIEKSLKALEIIKKKGVNVGNFIFYQSIKKVDDIVLPRETIFDLCSGDCQNGHLSKEEYDLLKEVLL